MTFKPHFSRFMSSRPERLHFAAHSHHPWPDVSFAAHLRAWTDAAEMMDDKWDHLFGTLLPETRSQIAGLLGIESGDTLAFAPSTHELVVRIVSCLEPPVRVLTSDAEFHSFSRQMRRWEEAGLAIADRVPAEPFESFSDRFTAEARSGVHDLIYLSEVFFDSGFVVPGLDRIVSSVSEERAFIVIDGYHAFMARPVSIGSIQDRVFYIAGGYKYAMAGEGACFLHAPPGFGPRPVDTGWFAGFGDLERGEGQRIGYGTDGSRFAGATFDPSGVYRMNAVFNWLSELGVGPGHIFAHVNDLQTQFLSVAPDLGELIPPTELERGNFLTFRSDRAEELYRKLHARDVIADHRADRLRLGFGLYHDPEDVDRLAAILDDIL